MQGGNRVSRVLMGTEIDPSGTELSTWNWTEKGERYISAHLSAGIPAMGKPVSGDLPVYKRVHGMLEISAVIDGVTPINPLSEALELIGIPDRYQVNEGGTDTIAPRIIKEFLIRMDTAYINTRLHRDFTNHNFPAVESPRLIFEINEHLQRMYHIPPTGYSLFSGFLETTLTPDKVPGATAAFCIHQYKHVEVTSIGDAPIFVILRDGRIVPAYIDSNKYFDQQTTVRINELISSGQASSAEDASRMLRSRGYYEDSYVNKRHIVPVLRGLPDIYTAHLQNSELYQIPVEKVYGVLLASDGFIYDLDLTKELDKERLVHRIGKLLTLTTEEEVTQYLYLIQEEQVENYNPEEPTRERATDDITVSVLIPNIRYRLPQTLKYAGAEVIGAYRSQYWAESSADFRSRLANSRTYGAKNP